MSHDGYQLAFENANREIAAIDALLEKLTRRRDILAQVMGPLQGLVADGASPLPAIETGETIEPASAGTPLHQGGEEGHAFGFAVDKGPETSDPYANGTSHSAEIPQTDVAELAYSLWMERGGLHGSHESDWLRAEEELRDESR